MTGLMRRFCLLVGQFLLFDLIWCIETTFTSFSSPELYVNAVLASLLLLLPYVLLRKDIIFFPIAFALDFLLIANLMYNRTYNSAIPLDSYLISGNLYDFLPSVVDSIRWYDALLPLSTLLFLIGIKRCNSPAKDDKKLYWKLLACSALISVTLVTFKGGLVKAMASLQNPNEYTCECPMYTVFGCMLHDLVKQQEVLTEQEKANISQWLSDRPVYSPLSDSIGKRRNLVLILCESLESWVLEKEIAGVSITPTLNKILQDSTTLFAPHVLTQVKGGRSIDCQLLVNAGMLPIQSGSYAFKYPDYHYQTLTQAMNESLGSDSWLLTVDNTIIWNQGIIAGQFGIRHILSRQDWKQSGEASGPRKNLADVPFFEQAVERLQQGDIWPEGQSVFLQFVTYSGHSPFKIAESMQRIRLPMDFPEKLRDYMITANYTDHALSILIDYLRSRPDYDETMIVIVGDHEGLASDREELCKSRQGKGLVSDKQFTPLIIVNSPIGLRYNEVMGQVDIYPTLLQLMHLDNHPWKGLGQSILDSHKYPIAIAPDMHVEGDTTNVPHQEIERLRQAYEISDKMIRYDYY